MKTFASIFLFLFAVFAADAASMSSWDSKAPATDPVEFVRSIELAEPRYKLPESLRNKTLVRDTPPDNKKEGYVVGGGLTAFTENVKGISKQDILDATLFAQLASDRKYDREHDTQNWYTYYKYILGNIGFVVENFSFQEYQASGGTFTMDAVVIELLAAIATGGQSIIITETLKAFSALANTDRQITIFSQQSASTNNGNFQVYPCDQAATGEVSMAMGAFYFNSDHHETSFLFFSWSSSNTHVYKGGQKTVLNQNVYSKVRSDVSAKLGDNAVNLVASIDLL